MFNFVTLGICFLFLIAVWKLQIPGASDNYSAAPTEANQTRDEFC